MPYDYLKTLAKALWAFLLALAISIVGIVADYLSGGAVVGLVTSSLKDAPAWLIAAVVSGVHAAGVALANWLKHRGDGAGPSA